MATTAKGAPAQKAPKAPMNRRTTYQAGGARTSGRGTVITTQGGGSTVTMNPGSQKGASRPAATSPTASSGKRPPTSGTSRKPSGGKQQKSRPGLPRSKGQPGGAPAYHNYQAIVLAEFVAAELLVAATPIASRKNQPGLSPYVPRDLVKLLAIGVSYFILQLFASG